MAHEEKYDEIDRYLRGEMQDADRLVFERQMRENPDLREEVDILRDVERAFREDDVLHLEEKLRCISQEEGRRRRAKLFGLPAPLVAAASVLFLVMAVILINRFRRPAATPQALFAQAERRNLPAYPPVLFPDLTSMERSDSGTGEPSDSLGKLIQVIQAEYESGKYTRALHALEGLPLDSIGTDRYFFYRGLLQLRSGRAGDAVRSFSQVGPGAFMQPARWNRAFALMAAGDIPAALDAFEHLAGQGYQVDQARDMLHRLRRLE